MLAAAAGVWQRSEDYGVPLEEVEPVFTGTDDLGSLFFQCGNEVLADLHRTLANEPVSLMLTDAEGVVLSPAVRRPQPAARRSTTCISHPGSPTPNARSAPTASGWRWPIARRRWCAPTSTTR